jgi:hypothetical protein
MNERSLKEGQWEDRKQWSLGVGQRRKTAFIYTVHCVKFTFLLTDQCTIQNVSKLVFPITTLKFKIYNMVKILVTNTSLQHVSDLVVHPQGAVFCA